MSDTIDYIQFQCEGQSFSLTLTVSGSTGLGPVESISGTVAGEAITGLSGFEGSDNTIDGTGTTTFVDYNGLSFTTANDTYNVYSLDNVSQIIDSDGAFPGGTSSNISNFSFADSAMCFLRGTRITTPDGETAVELIREGDPVLTHDGNVRPVRWIGTGRYLVPARRRNFSAPVIIRRGAFAEQVPSADLHVTGGHSFLFEDVLIPAEFLVNHRSIAWDDRAQEVEIFHLELEDHDILVANGAPAESYRDDGNRWMFQNDNAGWQAAPKPAKAPVLTGGPIVDAVWHSLTQRSGAFLEIPVTKEPDLHLLVDGLRLDGSRKANLYSFEIPAGAQSVVITSRAASQAELGLARDPRLLGVALHRIELGNHTGTAMLNAVGLNLQPGFHGYESDGNVIWTNGTAVVPMEFLASLKGDRTLRLHVAHTTNYLWLREVLPVRARSGTG